MPRVVLHAPGTAPWAGGDPDPGPTVEPFFEDNFEGGQKNPANGFTWGGNDVVNDRAFVGTHSLWMPFGPLEPDGSSHWWSEERFSFGQVFSEVWVEYRLWIPDNYIHDDNPVQGDNNKFFVLWDSGSYPGGGSGQVSIFVDTDRESGGTSFVRFMYSNQTDSTTTSGAPRWSNGISGANIGRWNRVGHYVRSATNDVSADGEYGLWWDDATTGEFIRRITATDLPLYDLADNGFQNGYLLGYDNSNFQRDTYFYIDAFKVYTTDPGWS